MLAIVRVNSSSLGAVILPAIVSACGGVESASAGPNCSITSLQDDRYFPRQGVLAPGTPSGDCSCPLATPPVCAAADNRCAADWASATAKFPYVGATEVTPYRVTCGPYGVLFVPGVETFSYSFYSMTTGALVGSAAVQGPRSTVCASYQPGFVVPDEACVFFKYMGPTYDGGAP